ncbi:MAG: hypothetical protein H8E21_15735 [Gammaproteobacteria bacterium]|nr:hypothetical protein [Gammaproteobacteria bacterium]
MTYHIETTDPVSGTSLKQLMSMPYVIESSEDESLVIYFESEVTRAIYLENPEIHKLEHYNKHPGSPHIVS